MIYIIATLFLLGVALLFLFVYSMAHVAGEADRKMEKYFKEKEEG